MAWTKNKKDSLINQQYYVKQDSNTVCKVCVKGVFYYELWVDKKFVKRSENFKDAIKDAIKDINKGNQNAN
jgi:hypothetical protein